MKNQRGERPRSPVRGKKRMHTVTKQWTEAELEALGFNKIVIGVPGRPLPIMAPNPNAHSQDTAYRLECIEDEHNPIIIWSQRTYGEVVGMIYRLLPTPSMLPLYYETLQLLQIENDRRIQFYIGKHGSGKSFLGRLIGDILHPDGAITINCADRDLNELLFETVLDVGANPDLYSKINDKLASGALNSTSVAALKSAVGNAFTQKDGQPYIDFEMVGSSRLVVQETEDGLTETEAVFSDADTQQVVETLLRIAQVEGLSESASFMPIKSQLGLLPRVWQQGRVGHLEEYNKCKEGTDTCLHPVLQVLNGENMSCRVYGSGGLSFEFNNKERRPGFFCYLDGNMMQDGVATHSLSASANDRVLPNIIQDMIKDDWQHRWCQLLTGMPIKILYESKKEQWDADPDGFTRFLQMIRGLGGKEIPAAHKHYIDRWEDVLDATDIISNYNRLYDEMTNPDSPANRQGKYPELFAEVDEEFYNMAGGSMRRNIYYFKMALLGRPQTKLPHLAQPYDMSESWDNPPSISPNRDQRRPETTLGTNVVDIFYRDMVRLTVGLGKVNLFTRLKVAFESLRMLKPTLQEGIIHDAVYLEDLLNSDPRDSDQAKDLQALFCNELRGHFQNIPMSDNDDDLLTQDQIRTALDKVASNGSGKSEDVRLSYIYGLNYQPLMTVDNMFAPYAVIDGLPVPGHSPILVQDDDLLDLDRFLTALALPKVGRKNQQRLWSTTIRDAIYSPLSDKDEAIAITAGDAGSGLSLNTVVTSGGLVHLLHQRLKGNMLVIAGTTTKAIEALMKEAGIDYVDRNLKNAKTRIRTFLNRALIKESREYELFLAGSFFHRNRLGGQNIVENPQLLEKSKLPELLSTADVQPVFPTYATQLTEQRRIKAYLDRTILETETRR